MADRTTDNRRNQATPFDRRVRANVSTFIVDDPAHAPQDMSAGGESRLRTVYFNRPMEMITLSSGITDVVCGCGTVIEDRGARRTMVFLNGGTFFLHCSTCGQRAERRVPAGTEMPVEPIDDVWGVAHLIPDARHVALFRRSNLIINFVDATGGPPYMKAGRRAS
jgi:hypothetical protein